MEPDLHVFARAPAGVPGAHAGNHAVGPGQGEGGGERIPGRGEQNTLLQIDFVFFRGKIFALTCVRPALPCRSLSSWRRPSWTTSRTGTSYKPTMCPPSHFHVPPRTLNVGSSTERVRHGDCRVRLFLSYFTDACLTKPQILRDSLHVADGKAIKLHLHSNLYLYASTDWNISQGNKSRQGEFY